MENIENLQPDPPHTAQCSSEELTHSLMKRNASLKKRKIKFDTSRDGKNIYLPTIFRERSSIEDVGIKSNHLLTDSLIELISHSLVNITRINLGRSSQLSNASFSALTKYCPLLEEVKMDHTSIGLGNLSAMNLHKHNRLAKLCLKGNKCLDNNTLKTIIGMCPNLQYLDVSNCSSLKVEGVLEILRTCAVDLLTELNTNFISSNFRYSEGSRTINLKKLQAKETGLDDKALGEIGKLCSGLEILDIRDCKKVTDTGVIEIMKICKNLKSIKFYHRHDVTRKILDTMVDSGIWIQQIHLAVDIFVGKEKQKLFWKNGCNFFLSLPHIIFNVVLVFLL